MYVISQSPGVARINSVWDCAVDLYIKNSLRYIRAIIYVYNELWGVYLNMCVGVSW